MPGRPTYFCPKHGPYDGEYYESCPYCIKEGQRAQQRPDHAPASPMPVPAPARPEADDDLPLARHGLPPQGYEPFNYFVASEVADQPAPAPYQADVSTVLSSDHGTGSDEEDATVISMPEAQTPLAFFLVKSPAMFRGTAYAVRPDGIVGRKHADVIIQGDKKISRQHARLTFVPDSTQPDHPGTFFVTDLNTANGTYVNGMRIAGEVALAENDEIGMGETLFVFKILW